MACVSVVASYEEIGTTGIINRILVIEKKTGASSRCTKDLYFTSITAVDIMCKGIGISVLMCDYLNNKLIPSTLSIGYRCGSNDIWTDL
jgi:hypothetical protein